MATDKTYYELLDLPMNATVEEIRKAYHKRANECHPDRVRNLDHEIQALAQLKMTKVNEAYQTLTDQQRRSEYDQWLLANADIKVDPSGKIRHLAEERAAAAAAAAAAAPPPPTTDQLVKQLEEAINSIKNQVLKLDPTIKWKEISQEGFDVVMEGLRRIERYYIYINTVDCLRRQDIENLTANIPAITAEKHFLLHKKYSLFMVLHLDVEGDDQVRALIRDFNNAQLNQPGNRRSDLSMVAIGCIKTKELFFPYMKGFQVGFEKLKLP